MTQKLGALLEARTRHALVSVIRSHPEWTLGQIARLVTRHRRTLGRVSLGEIRGPAVDRERVEQAQRLTGPEFDACVLEVVRDAPGKVDATYLRDRVGGPRWKVQLALARLFAAGVIERGGSTSATRYWLAQP